MQSEKTNRLIWYASVVCLLLIAFAYFLSIFDYWLPLPAYIDELRNMNQILLDRGQTTETDILKQAGYPPAILWLHHLAQHISEAITGETAFANQDHVLYVVRSFSIVACLLCASLIIAIGKALAHWWVGVLAAVMWLFNPSPIEFALYGIPQVYELLCYLGAFYIAWLALRNKRPALAVASVGIGLVGVLFKYTIFPILGLGVGVALWYIMQSGKRRQQWLRAFSIQALMIGSVAFGLISSGVVDSLISEDHFEATQFTSSGGLSNLLNFPALWNLQNLLALEYGLPLIVFWLVLFLGMALYVLQAKVHQRVAAVLWIICTFAYPIFLITYIYVYALIPRYNLTISGVVILMLFIGLDAILRFVVRNVRWQRYIPLGLLAFALFWNTLLFDEQVAFYQERTAPVYPALLSRWAAPTFDLSDGTMLVSDNRTFDYIWGYYLGPPRTWFEGDISDRSIDAWLEDYVLFAEVRPERQQELESTAEGRALLDQLLLIRQLPNSDAPRHRSSFIYRLQRMQQEVTVTFGDQLTLVGYDLETVNDQLLIRLYWQALTNMDTDYQAFVHLTTADDATPLAQIDVSPARATRPTTTWDDTGEILVSQLYTMPIPDNLATDEPYVLRLGIYDPATGQRLSMDEETATFEIDISFD